MLHLMLDARLNSAWPQTPIVSSDFNVRRNQNDSLRESLGDEH
jgi:hypothetical protein